MCCDPEFCPAVHIPRTDLYFYRFPARPDNCCMQRLVHIQFRHGNIIFESARKGLPPCVHSAERSVTVPYGINNDPDAYKVINILKIMASDDHLLINAEIVFWPARYISFNILRIKVMVDVVKDPGQELVPVTGALLDQQDDLVIYLWMERLE